MGFWKAIELWPDSTVFIIGGGESLIGFDYSPIKNYRIIGVNNAYGDLVKKTDKKVYYAPRDWVDVCFFGDTRWFEWHRESLKSYSGLIVTSLQNLKSVPWIKCINRSNKEGIEKNKNLLSWNRCSGLSAINLAVHFGAKKIILLGFDMKKGNGRDNYHNDHLVNADIKYNPYERFMKSVPHIKADADKLGIEIINTCMDSGMDHFPKVPFEEVLKDVESGMLL